MSETCLHDMALLQLYNVKKERTRLASCSHELVFQQRGENRDSFWFVGRSRNSKHEENSACCCFTHIERTKGKLSGSYVVTSPEPGHMTSLLQLRGTEFSSTTQISSETNSFWSLRAQSAGETKMSNICLYTAKSVGICCATIENQYTIGGHGGACL